MLQLVHVDHQLVSPCKCFFTHFTHVRLLSSVNTHVNYLDKSNTTENSLALIKKCDGSILILGKISSQMSSNDN